jgi:Holliday junction DNA helicase RuvB
VTITDESATELSTRSRGTPRIANRLLRRVRDYAEVRADGVVTLEIARAALEVTVAYHELERFETDAEFRDLLSSRVAEHIKVLRRKIGDRGLASRDGADVRLSDEVAVRILIEHGIITSADLGRLADPAWRSRQEDLWWTEG